MGNSKMTYITWQQYGILIDRLYENVKAYLDTNNLHVDLIVPILREGGFTALPLSYKLNTYKLQPIQFKYQLNDGGAELKQLSKMPEVLFDVPQNPVILLCDTFPAGGNTKVLATEAIKEKYPNSTIIFISLFEDPASKNVEGIKTFIFALTTDSNNFESSKIMKEMGITNIMNVLLPWENEKEELAGINKKAYSYN